ncbi:hypothetical protein JMM59_01405 [Rhodovulum sulfidophilum]|uniref:hypothetical protein n=1 Tax=Rhodovulum sulfidophilum TaxID=35806 RepID=UPI0019207881|nr:hypothetical protein [Rhodovulum sulfidophilum]MBL3563679.1 hypothetical protein [Rhodovulum sulfidophilum]
MLIRVNIVVHLFFFAVIVAFSGYSAFDLTQVLVGFLMVGVTGHSALVLSSRQRRGNGLGALTIGLVVFFWLAYTAKFGMAMFIADEYWVVPHLIDTVSLLRVLPEAYFLSMIGFVSVVIAIIAFPLRHSIDWKLRPGKARVLGMLLLLCLCLVIKYFLKARFFLAVPGMDPIQLPIPYLSGILALLLGYAMLFFANVPLFLALFTGNRWAVFVTFLAAMANAGIDLRFGSKDTVMFQMTMIVAYLFMFRVGLESGRAKFKRTARGMIIIIGVLGIGLVSAYKYMNFIRFAFFHGATSIADAISMAAQSDVATSRSSLIELYNRITGIEAFSAVMQMAEARLFSVSLSDMLSGNLMRAFSDMFLGGIDTTSAFSMTLIGSWYAYGRISAIIGGFLVTGGLFAAIQTLIVRAPGAPHNMRLAFLPVYWIMCVQLMLGGNPMIWLKTIIVTLPFVYFIGRLAFTTTSRLHQTTLTQPRLTRSS